jgi:hypothetical protein
MSDDGLSKIKAFVKDKSEKLAEKAGHTLGEAAFELKKALEKAYPFAQRAINDLVVAAKSAKASFDQAMEAAEAKARENAKQRQTSGNVNDNAMEQKPVNTVSGTQSNSEQKNIM